MKKITWLVLVSILLTLTISLMAKTGPQPKAIPVTTTIQDFDSTTGFAYDLRSDSLGFYKNGINSIISEIQPIGDWSMDASSSTSRRVQIDLSDPASTTNSAAPFATASVAARLISKCSEVGNNMRSMIPGNTYKCPLGVRFLYNGGDYAVRMNPANFATSEFAQWSCQSTDAAGKCNAWKLEPSVVRGFEKKIVGQLIKYNTVKNSTIIVDLGTYYFSFTIDVTNP